LIERDTARKGTQAKGEWEREKQASPCAGPLGS